MATVALLAVGIPTVVSHHGDAGDGSGGSIELTTAGGFSFTRPARSGGPLGVYQRKDGFWYGAVLGTTAGSTAPTAVDAGHPTIPPPPTTTSAPTGAPTAPGTNPTASATPTTSVVPPAGPTSFPAPTGVFPAGAAHSFAAPVDLSAYAGLADNDALIRVGDGTTSTTVAATLYQQTETNVRASTRPLGANVTITATMTDQYGLPIVGAPMRLDGRIAGGAHVDQLAVTNALGQVTFTGPGVGSGPVPATGYPAGAYLVYADHNLNDTHGGKEPSYQVINGPVSFAAPGKAFYHNDKHIKKAGGVYADATRGTKAAHAKGYSWIDQDGQLVYRSKPQKLAGAARLSRADDLVWVNAHGSPFNPKWLKKGHRFETKTWNAIKHRPGLRDAGKTLKQNAKRGISVEWEVKDVRPFTKAATLDAAFANLAALAKQYYGAGWASKVEIKVLSNLKGGQKYALKVLKRAHGFGFTTMFLARGKATKAQIPAGKQKYVTYVRGAAGGLYPGIPSPAQDAPVVVRTPRIS